MLLSQRTHDVIITSLLRQNDVATSFWRNNDVVITSCVRWVLGDGKSKQTTRQSECQCGECKQTPHPACQLTGSSVPCRYIGGSVVVGCGQHRAAFHQESRYPISGCDFTKPVSLKILGNWRITLRICIFRATLLTANEKLLPCCVASINTNHSMG